MLPQLSTSVALATLLVVSYFAYCIIYNLFFNVHKAHPGPRLWAISRLPYYWAQFNGNLDQRMLEFHEKYGLVTRIGPNDLSYATEVVWRDVWSHRQGHPEFMKTAAVLPPNGVPGLLQAPRHDHARFRKLLSHAFSERGLREQEPRIMSYVDLLIQRLRERAPLGPQDVVAWFNWTTFDMIGDLAFGEPFGCLENARPHFWIEAIFGNLKAIVYARILRFYGLLWLVPYITPKHVSDLRMANQKYSEDKIARRIQIKEPRGDFFDRVLQKQVDQGGMTEDELVSNAGNLVLGGSETTATLLSGTILLLLTHPHVLEKLNREVRDTFTKESEIDTIGVNQLHYMLAVFQEAMRIYPPVPQVAPRIVPAGGATVNHTFLPEKTSVNVSIYAINRLARNYTRPTEFIPERWLLSEADKQQSEFAKDNRAVSQPFSVGTRNCIGRNLAYAEMRLILAKVLYHFDIAFPDDNPPQLNWIKGQRTWLLWEKTPLWVKFVVRDEQLNK